MPFNRLVQLERLTARVQILGSGPGSLPKRSADYQFIDIMYIKGKRGKLQSMIATYDEDAWRHVRKAIEPAFSPACIRYAAACIAS